jgi:lipoate-protein ligase A
MTTLPAFHIQTEFLRDGAYHMRRDEELVLEARENPDFSPILRLYSWQPYAISLGYQQKDDEIDMDAVRANGIDVVRRPTGGRAVYHAEELTYAVIQRFEPSQGVYAVHNAIIELLVDALRPLTGEKLQLTSNEAGKTTREVYKEGLATNIACFASISRHEVTYEGKKVIGSAQRRFGNAVLQHGSILLDKEHLRLPEFLKIDDEQKATMRSLLERESATLSEICGKKLTAEDVAGVIMNPSMADFQSALSQTTPNSKLPAITDELHISHRNLPHRQQGGSVYFITFRSLRGNLPEAAREIVKQRILFGHDKF